MQGRPSRQVLVKVLRVSQRIVFGLLHDRKQALIASLQGQVKALQGELALVRDMNHDLKGKQHSQPVIIIQVWYRCRCHSSRD